MSAHTPGPWGLLPVECDRPYIRVRGTRLGQRYKIANVMAPVYENVHEREADETRANAQLISAAPDLLAALQRLAAAEKALESLPWGENYDSDEAAMKEIAASFDTARAAITKATGEAP